MQHYNIAYAERTAASFHNPEAAFKAPRTVQEAEPPMCADNDHAQIPALIIDNGIPRCFACAMRVMLSEVQP